MAGLIVILVLALGIAAMMQIFADRVESGSMQPNMGHHTQASTTPESWQTMRVIVIDAMRLSAKCFVASALVMLVVAALSASITSGVAFGSAGIGLAAIPVVLGSIRGLNALVPNGSITR